MWMGGGDAGMMMGGGDAGGTGSCGTMGFPCCAGNMCVAGFSCVTGYCQSGGGTGGDAGMMMGGGDAGMMTGGDAGSGGSCGTSGAACCAGNTCTRPGLSYGESDDYGYNIVKDPVHIHDLQATILRCLGIDHQRLTYRFQGRDFRLTDVAGNVVGALLG
jgi:hypothetical protein